MAKYREIKGKDYRMIILRFRNQEDLDLFSAKLGYAPGILTDLTTEVMVPGGVLKTRKSARKPRTKEKWKATWKGMPHFHNEDTEAYSVVRFFFDDTYSSEDIALLTEQNVSDKTTSLWYPVQDFSGAEGYLRVIGGTSETHFPVYVVSKGRHDCCLTSQFLTMCEVKHYVVVEEFQKADYEGTVGQSPYTTIITIPQRFFDEYETLCSYENEIGETRKTGPGAARNFCWWHSMQNGFFAHHVLDDNIRGFHMLSDNCKFKVRTGAFIRAFEEHFMAFDNIALCGPCYASFAPKTENRGCHIFNTRIYSWITIRNDIWDKGFKWRGRYNEDTILSIDVMKAGYATLQYYMFLQYKIVTQAMKGGNTEEFYAEEGTTRKSRMLEEVHPDVAKVTWRFSRVHHMVDYSPFAENDPQFRPERLPDGINDYGMYIVKIDKDDNYTIDPLKDSKSALEAKYTREQAIYLWDGTRWQNGFDLIKDFKEKGY